MQKDGFKLAYKLNERSEVTFEKFVMKLPPSFSNARRTQEAATVCSVVAYLHLYVRRLFIGCIAKFIRAGHCGTFDFNKVTEEKYSQVLPESRPSQFYLFSLIFSSPTRYRSQTKFEVSPWHFRGT